MCSLKSANMDTEMIWQCIVRVSLQSEALTNHNLAEHSQGFTQSEALTNHNIVCAYCYHS